MSEITLQPGEWIRGPFIVDRQTDATFFSDGAESGEKPRVYIPVLKKGLHSIPIVLEIDGGSGTKKVMEQELNLPDTRDGWWIGQQIFYVTKSKQVFFVRITGLEAGHFVTEGEVLTLQTPKSIANNPNYIGQIMQNYPAKSNNVK